MNGASEGSERRPERLNLRESDDPRDAVLRAAACLARGGVVALPTETIYTVAAGAFAPDALDRMRAILKLSDEAPLPIHTRGVCDLDDWMPGMSPTLRRILSKAWPGPLSVRAEAERLAEGGPGLLAWMDREARDRIAPRGVFEFRSLGHSIFRDVADLLPGPLSARGVEADHPVSLESLDGLDMILDAGPPRSEYRSTIIRVAPETREGYEIVRAGRYGPKELERMSATLILFVCTGNTCRSPMAEALCRRMLADRLDCDPSEIASRGYEVASAGLSAARGAGASEHAIRAAADFDADLRRHASRPLTPELVREADHVFTMTRDHMRAIVSRMPEARGKTTLLSPELDDVLDPYGADLETYMRTAAMIERCLARRLDAMFTA